MSYNTNYLFTHNVDWYACINGVWVYAASRGGRLPELVDNESMLPILQGVCANLPDVVNKENIVINQELIKERYQRAKNFYEQRFGDKSNDNIGWMQNLKEFNIDVFGQQFSELFIDMARKGFYSFVRVDIDNPISNEYRLVAYPKDGSPESLTEILHRPFNATFVDKEYNDYIKSITFHGTDEVLSFSTNLDLLF